jgi:hypothetical protein
MENVGIFYDHLEYIIAIWYNLWPFCIVIWSFFQFGMFGQKKSGNPDTNQSISNVYSEQMHVHT